MNNGKYNNVKDDIISYIREGDSNVLACKKAGISESSFYEWVNKIPEFSEALKNARKEFRAGIIKELETSLWKRATGFEFDETKTDYVAENDGKPIIIKQTKIKKFIPPDTGALVFALTNLDPENWKNRQDNRLSVDDGISGFKISVVHKEGTPPIANSEDDIAD